MADALKDEGAQPPPRAHFPLALGSVKFGRNRGVKYPAAFELPDDTALDRLLETAWEGGVRLFDTAPAYGEAESRLRPFVLRHRDAIRICTKAGEEFDGEHSRFDFSGAAIRTSCERSLRRLGCERLDLLLLHSDGADRERLERDGALTALRALREAGKVRAIGLSAKTSPGIAYASSLVDAIMAPYSLADSQHAGALRAAHAKGCTVLAIKALASGHAATGGDASALAERALTHVLQQPFVDFVVLGTLRLDHLDQALSIARRYTA